MDATMLWPTPRNFVRSLRCTLDVLLWSQKQAFRLLAPFLGFDATRPNATAGEARAASEVAATIEAIDEIVAIDGPVEDVEAVVEELEAIEELEAAEELEAIEAAVAAPAPPATPDDLTIIGGVGPKLAERLTAAGVTTFATLAAWQADDVERFEATLPPVQRGRVEREGWIGQARLLALTAT